MPGEATLPVYSAEIAFSPVVIRLAGLAVFAVLTSIALLAGLFDGGDFLDMIADVYITIPLVVGSYLVRFVFQMLALTLFSGLERGQVRVGFSDRNISPFVHAKRPFELAKFRLYLLMPFVFMSLLPLLIMPFYFHPVLYIVASYTAAFCINDVLTAFRSFRYAGYMLAADHPRQFGMVLYDNPFHNI